MLRKMWAPLFLFMVSDALAQSAPAQTCSANIQKTKPDSQYRISPDGTEVTDTKTGLIWQRCALGMSWVGNTCAGTATNYTWENALAQAASVASSTQVAWRLPNEKELKSLVETACTWQAVNEIIFPATPADAWSSSAFASGTNNAWYVNFDVGNNGQYGKSDGLAVRLVRSQ